MREIGHCSIKCYPTLPRSLEEQELEGYTKEVISVLNEVLKKTEVDLTCLKNPSGQKHNRHAKLLAMDPAKIAKNTLQE